MLDMQPQEREIRTLTIAEGVTLTAIDEGDDYTIVMSAESWNRAVAKLRGGQTLKGLALVMEPDGDVAIAFMVGDQAGFVIRRPQPSN
jgi:hypothetical protein